MSYFNAGSRHRWRAIAAALVAVWTLVVGAQWGLPGTENAPPHEPHTVVTSATGASVTVAFDHSHLSQPDTALTPDTLAEAILPRGAVSLIALGLAVAFAVLPVLGLRAALTPIRGPPRRALVMLTGRDVLARLCIARR